MFDAQASYFESQNTASVHPKTLAAQKRDAQVPFEIRLLTPRQVARALSVSQITVWRYTERGLLHALKLGDAGPRCARRYRARDIAQFIESRLAPKSAGVTK
jgi:hypothetical protein